MARLPMPRNPLAITVVVSLFALSPIFAADAVPPPFTSTIGGSHIDQGWSVAVSGGNSWVAGLTYSADVPCAGGFKGGSTDAFVAKFDAAGGLLWCVVLGGGSSDGTVPYQTPAIAIDSSGNAWITGASFSSNFPVTTGGAACGANVDIFGTKLGPDGGLLFSGCFGSPSGDGGSGIAVDAFDNAWITGFTNSDAFVLVLNPDGTTQNWSTFGGSNTDQGIDIQVATSGLVYVVGITHSADFAVTNGSSCTLSDFGACFDGFLRVYSPGGHSVVSSTFFGTTFFEEVRSLSLDSDGNAYVGGYTRGPGQAEHGFILSLAPDGLLRYHTTLAGDNRDWVNAVAADAAGNAWVAGSSLSHTLFLNHPPTLGSAFLTRVNASGTGFWCTQRFQADILDLAAGSSDSVYLSGIVSSQAGSADAWLSRIVDGQAPQLTVTLTPSSIESVNHRLADITATVTVFDYCDPMPEVVLLSIVSTEADNGLGDADTPNDIQEAVLGTDDRQFKVRAERSGQGSGRIYTVTYRATDSAGNSTDAAATVTVRAK